MGEDEVRIRREVSLKIAPCLIVWGAGAGVVVHQMISAAAAISASMSRIVCKFVAYSLSGT